MKKTLHSLFLLLMLAAGANTMSAAESNAGSRSVSPETPSWWGVATTNSPKPTWFEVRDYAGNLLTGDNIELFIVEGDERSGDDYDGLDIKIATADEEDQEELDEAEESAPEGEGLRRFECWAADGNYDRDIMEKFNVYTGKFQLKKGTFGKVEITATCDMNFLSLRYAEATPVSYTLTYEAKVSLDESSDNADVLKKTIESCKDGTVVAADLTRTLVGGKWNTLCLPFSTAIEGTALEGAVVKEIGSIEDNVINLVDATKIEAGKPYLVKPQQDVVNPRFHNALFTASEGTATGNDTYRFVGAIAPKAVGEGENIWGVSASGKLAKVKADSTINGMRAYFVFSGSESAAKLNFDGEATGIIGTEAAATAKAANGKVYNLNGQCVGTDLNALPHGLYIVDGKKVTK